MCQNVAYTTTLGSRLLMTVYKGIAPGEDRKALPSLDVNSKRLADGLLQLSFSLSQQVGATVKEFNCRIFEVNWFVTIQIF